MDLFFCFQTVGSVRSPRLLNPENRRVVLPLGYSQLSGGSRRDWLAGRIWGGKPQSKLVGGSCSVSKHTCKKVAGGFDGQGE